MSNRDQEIKDNFSKGYIAGVEDCIFRLRNKAQEYFDKNNDYVGKLLTAQALSIEKILIKFKKEKKL